MKRKRILVVDDEEHFVRLIKMNLETEGKYEVKTETNPAEALATARNFNPHLILLDVVMPGKDGGEIASEMKADETLKNIPIVFVTAAATEQELDSRQKFIGGHPFIAKPVDCHDLLNIIEKNIL